MNKQFFCNKFFVANFILVFLKNVFTTFIYFWMFVLFNQIFSKTQNILEIWVSSGFIVSFALITFILNYLYRYLYMKHISNCLSSMYKNFSQQIANQHPGKFNQKSSQEHLFKIYEIPGQISGMYFQTIYLIINDLFKFLGIIIIFFYFNWVIEIIIVVLSVLTFLFTDKLSNLMTDYYYKNVEISEKNRYELEIYFKNFSAFFYANKLKNWFSNLKFFYNQNKKKLFLMKKKKNFFI